MHKNKNTMNIPFSLNDKAIKEIKNIISKESETKTIRIGVKGGGCSGLSYVLEIAAQESDDELYQLDGITFLLKPAHKIYIQNMHIEYDDGLNARGFTFKNPNASKTCGCGSSFAV